MKQSERGFTVPELAAVLAISAIIAVGAGMTTMQIIRGSENSQDSTTVTNQAHNVGYMVSRDILTAQSLNAADDPGTADTEFVLMDWKDWETGDTYDIRYIWFDSSDSLYKLKRQQVTRDKDYVTTSNKTTLIADYIYSANLTEEDSLWRLTVEARSGEKSLTREYAINKRQG